LSAQPVNIFYQDHLICTMQPLSKNVGSMRSVPRRQEIKHASASGVSAGRAPVAVEPLELRRDQAEAMVAWLTDGDAKDRKFATEQITILFQALCVTQEGSRVIQKTFEMADPDELLKLAQQLDGRVKEFSRCPHGNHVLQRAIELLPSEHVQFIVNELSGRAVVTARHKFGCRILQRLIEHCPSWQVSALINEVMSDADRLCRHPFGNFVLQHILEHGTEVQRSLVVAVMLPAARGLANHRVGSHVLQRALASCKVQDREILECALAGSASERGRLARGQYGSYVMRELVSSC